METHLPAIIPSPGSHSNIDVMCPVSFGDNKPVLGAYQNNCKPSPHVKDDGMNTVHMDVDCAGQIGAEQKPTPKQNTGANNTKDIPVEDLEFDGNTVLCRVCGDKASGFHYGVHACEGCKGFFRRSIQQKIQYRPCLKNQMCNIMRVNRNRCQYCRLRKCIAVGMSRDAVRFGRVPKREKAKIMEQMQKVNAQLQDNLLSDALRDQAAVTEQITAAHQQYCDFTHAKFKTLLEKAWKNPTFVNCPAHMACPLSPATDHMEGLQKWDEFSNCFTPAIKNVVSFAKSIPGFVVFNHDDQVTLLKAGTFEVLLIHLACLFDNHTNTMMFTNGHLYQKLPQQGNTSAGFLLDSMFDFADRLNQLHLTDDEVALFSALVITAPDRPGLRYHDHVNRTHSVISHNLQKMMTINHPDEPTAFTKLLMMIPDLRTLNTLHSEKLLGLTVPQSEGRKTPPCDCPDPDGAVEDKYKQINIRPSSPPVYPDMSTVSSQYPDNSYPVPQSTSSSMSGGITVNKPFTSVSQKELALQMPYGAFHCQNITTQLDKPVQNSTAGPDDFIDADIQKSSTNTRQPSRMDAFRRRDCTEPSSTDPANQRKRLQDNNECEVDPKLARLWEYEMRSSRSNSLSSSSSIESTDSAYRTISNPGTPRSHYDLVRSPALQGQGHDSDDRPIGRLPTLRQILLSGPGGLRPIQSVDSGVDEIDDYPDKHYFLHKKLKLKHGLSESSDDRFRGRASSFSVVVGRPVAKSFVRPRSVEAPPRLSHNGTNESEKVKAAETEVGRKDLHDEVQAGSLEAMQICVEAKEADMELSRDQSYSSVKTEEQGITELSHDPVKDGEPEMRELTHEKIKDSAVEVKDLCLARTSDPSLKDASQQMGKADYRDVTDTRHDVKPIDEERKEPVQLMVKARNDDTKDTADNMELTRPKTGAASAKEVGHDLEKTVSGLSLASDSSDQLGSNYHPHTTNKPASSAKKPSQRHPELLSRLTSAPRTHPPRLYPITDPVMMVGRTLSDQDPPSLLSVSQALPISSSTQEACQATSHHLSAISSLKDKILKRIDSQENLAMPAGLSPWPRQPGAHSNRGSDYHVPCGSSLSNPDGPMPSQCPPAPGTSSTALPPPMPSFYPGTASIPPPQALPTPNQLHPALLFNSAVHLQALQHLQAQAAHLQQMVMMSSGASSECQNHNNSKAMEPINLTKDQRHVTQSANIKSEPL